MRVGNSSCSEKLRTVLCLISFYPFAILSTLLCLLFLNDNYRILVSYVFSYHR
jgi:hypothetical protein